MTADNLDQDHVLRERATYWFTRMQSGDATAAEQAACQAWRQADPANEQAYANVAFFWQASRHVPEQAMRGLLSESASVDAAACGASNSRTRRRMVWGLAGAGALALAAVMLVPVWLPESAQYQSVWQTGHGERAEVDLPDGSQLNLNVNTQLQVAFYEGRREVTLLAGEAFFTVAPDTDRPFLVQASPLQVEVTGTRFNVRREGEIVSVGVESGAVKVSKAGDWRMRSYALRGGQGVHTDARGELSAVEPIAVDTFASWRQGQVVFENARLDVVIAELNRYLPQAIRLEAPRLRNYRVAGMFHIDDPESLLAALPVIAPVQLVQGLDGQIKVFPR